MLTGLLSTSCAVLTSFSSFAAVSSELLPSFSAIGEFGCVLTLLSALLAVSSDFTVSAISDVAAADCSGSGHDKWRNLGPH